MVSKCISSTKRREYFIVIATSGIIKGCRYVESGQRRIITLEVEDDDMNRLAYCVIKLCGDGLSTGYIIVNGHVDNLPLHPDSKLRNVIIDRLTKLTTT